MMSSTDYYLLFCHMLLNGGGLAGGRRRGPRTVAYMGRNHLPGGKLLNELGQSTFAESAMEGTGFGLGFSTIEDAPALQNLASEGEIAWGGAASTCFWVDPVEEIRSEEHTSELQSLMRISYAVFCLKTKTIT